MLFCYHKDKVRLKERFPRMWLPADTVRLMDGQVLIDTTGTHCSFLACVAVPLVCISLTPTQSHTHTLTNTPYYLYLLL